jgi:hypothetical protein
MAIYGTQFLERIQFFNGQRLFASDLQSLEAFNREMRWLHNQSLHQPGVGSGYAVTGNKGDKQVTITPGYALNSLGQEIILTETHVEPIPPVADNGAGASAFYDLTVSYPDDTALKPSETRDGICLPTGVVRLREEPVFCWVQLGDDGVQPVDQQLKDRIQKGLFIVLARIEVFNCQLKQPVSVIQRRNARPAKQPYIACGKFTPSATDWGVEVFPKGAPLHKVDPGLGGLQFPSVRIFTQVNTSTGGFQATPEYTVRLIGDRPRQDSAAPPNYFLVDGLIDVAPQPAPTPTSFWVDIFPFVWTVVLGTVSPNPIPADGSDLYPGWQIGWMGVES